MLVATWIAAIATSVLAVGAAAAYLAQSQQLKIVRDQNKRDIYQRLTSQAARVFISGQVAADPAAGTYREAAVLTNASDEPIYDLVAEWKDAIQWKLPYLLPGEEQEFPAEGLVIKGDVIPMTLEFRDARDCQWRTTNHGHLQQLRAFAPWTRPALPKRTERNS